MAHAASLVWTVSSVKKLPPLASLLSSSVHMLHPKPNTLPHVWRALLVRHPPLVARSSTKTLRSFVITRLADRASISARPA
jgi:hypothetical protein